MIFFKNFNPCTEKVQLVQMMIISQQQLGQIKTVIKSAFYLAEKTRIPSMLPSAIWLLARMKN